MSKSGMGQRGPLNNRGTAHGWWTQRSVKAQDGLSKHASGTKPSPKPAPRKQHDGPRSERQKRVIHKVLKYIKAGGRLRADGRVFSVIRDNGKHLSVKFEVARQLFAQLLVYWSKTMKRFDLTIGGAAMLECR